ncbi:MAG TPA: NifU family protein [Kiritimatiellia bacterium]|nr:NifU family protein [Kiritimatiellia bacterium]HMO98719.1 NifU family protein [Kiritimatiellia bacterium]HMP97928.1 NifU family protein [Kiritimatiellia bacterium]
MTTAPATFKISGELTGDPMVCKFHCERPILDDWTVVFSKPEDSLGSPLIDALFAVEGVAAVTVSGSTLTVTKSVPTPWPHLAADIAKAIRGGCAGEEAPINPAVVERLKNMPMDEAAKAIADLFEQQINPALASHGGFVKLVKIEDRDVYVEMGGGCQGCSSARATMRFGVEGAIRRVAPQIRHIIDATDHAAGENPYYT